MEMYVKKRDKFFRLEELSSYKQVMTLMNEDMHDKLYYLEDNKLESAKGVTWVDVHQLVDEDNGVYNVMEYQFLTYGKYLEAPSRDDFLYI